MKTSTCNMNNRYIVLIIIFLISTLSHAQLKKGFEPRFNESVNGDFAMIANNMVSVNPIMPYNDEGNNDGINLVYVDIDGNTGIGANTFNSSSAEFKNPVTNLPSTNCLTIKRVLLYWAAADKEPDDNDISSENQPDWDFNDIKLMLPGQTNYVDYEADEVLYRGRDDNGDGIADDHFANDPYVCVKDITTFVNNNLPINGGNAYGVYQVANVECKTGQLVEHDALFNTGVSGGWQIVFVYESPLLIKKNVSIYDGYIHVSSTGLPQYGITIDNFQTVPAPQAVNVKILMGSLEGDRGRVGDRLEIENALNTFVPITTDPVSPIRPLNNFFNSRITIDNNNFLDRIPASENTLGFDAAIFDLSNPNNSIIQNDQTSANFRLTTTIETYGMFLLGLSVDVFEPDLGPIEVLTNAASTPQSPGTIINADFTVENKGNDNAVNVTISSTLPPQIEVNDFAGLLLTLPTGVNATYIGNVLTFTVDDQYVEVGDSPIDVDFDLIIKDECYFLNDNCDDLSFGLEFIATYSGATNPEVQSTNSSSDLDACGVGNDQETIITVIQPTGPIINAPTNETISSCSFNSQTEANTAFTDWLNQFSVGGSCNINGQFDQTYTAPNFCGGSVTVIYEVTDLCTPLASETRIFEIAAPIAISYTAPADETSDACNYNDQNALNTAFNSWVTSQTAAFAIANGCSPSISNDSATASIPVLCDGGITTITWTINDICQTTLTETADFTVTAPTAITYTAPADVTSDACEYTDQNALDTAFNNWVTTQNAAFAIANGCSPVISNNSATASIPVLCDGGVSTVTWMINDLCETFTETAEFRVTAPTAINLPSNETNTVNCIADATETFIIPAVNDACGNPIIPSAPVIVESPIILDCEGTRTYTYTYSDCAGNSAEWEYLYTIEIPTFTITDANGEATVNCVADATETFTLPSIIDACGNPITPSAAVIVDSPNTLDCQGTRTYKYTYSDCAGNSAEWEYVYTIEIPTFTITDANGEATVNCVANATETFTLPSIIDACGNPITPSAAVIVDSPNTLDCEGTRTYTYTYSDCAGNSAEWEYVYTIDLMSFVLPGNTTETVDNIDDATEPTPPNVLDNCGNTITPSAPSKSETPDCQGSVVYTFTYVDCSGNSADWSYTYTIELAPFSVPPSESSIVECIADATPPAPPSVLDANGDEITPVVTSNEDPACEGDKIYTFTYTDCAGNSGVWEYTYTINITTLPVVPTNASSTVECLTDAVQPIAPEITDVCGNIIIPVATENADPVCEGDKIYTFTYLDCAGNISVYTYTYTIDITSNIIVPDNDGSTVECLANATQPSAPVVTDVCGNEITPEITENEDPDCEGEKIYTFTYTDCTGNEAVYTYRYTIDITTGPTVPANDGSTVQCVADAIQPTPPIITDICGSNIIPVITESADPTCEGEKIYTFTFTDCTGNESVYIYTYTIDLTPFILPNNGIETVDNLANAVEPTPPPVSDNCGNEIIPSTPVKSETPDCQGSVVYTFTYVDCSGNSADWSYTYTIELAPFSVPPSESSIVECIADATPPAPPSVLDANGDEITPVVTSNEDPACEGDKIYTFTYTDCAGNSGVWEYTYTINITTLPVVPTNASSTVECLTDAVQPIAPEITDVCGNIIIPVATENADPVCEGDKIYTFTYLDCAGNISVYTYTYTIDITSNIIVPDNDGSTVECLANATQPSAPVVTDVCGNEITPEITENEDPDCEGEKIYTFTYTDCTGNEAVYTYRYTIDITTGPTVPANDGSTVQCVADAIQPTPPIITDICGSNIIPVITESADPTCEGEKIYTFTFTDCTGNESVYIYTYTIDLTPFILPANGIQAIDNLEDVEEPTPPNVTDNCGNIITPSAPLKSETPDCQGSVIYTFTYTDCAGNSADWSYSFSIELAPFSVPSNEGSNIECIADAIAPEPPTILDANGDLIVPVMTESPDPACEGNKVFSFTYTDCAGNSGVWEYTYTINLITLPNVPTDAFSSVECLADASQPVSPVVTDFCGNNIVPVITENEDPICGGEKVYTFTYIDCTGNESIYIYTYTIDIVTTPIVPESTGSTVECLANATQPIAPVVTDVCGNEITPVVTENADPICEGEKIFTYTYTDCKGNDSIYIYTYTIDVTSGPLVPANSGSIVECVADATQPNIPVVTDICGNNMSPIITESEDPGCEGEKIYTFTYTDCSGNVSEYIYTYEVKDTTRPVLILPDNVSAECSGDLTPISFGEATAIDNCDPNPIVTFIDETTEGACAGSFSITRTWTAIDACGNSVSANQVISASDITPPEFDQTELPRDIVVACDAIPEADTLTATDNCGDAIVTVEDEKITGTCPNNYNIERSYIATDECGTTTIHLQTIRVQDITPPTFVETLPNINIVVQCDNIPDAEILTATDNCGDAVVSVRDVRTNGDCPNNYNIARTWVATDACGLTTAHTQNIIVQDTTPPEFVETLPTDTTVECNAIPEAQILTATDNCSDAKVTVSDIRTNGDCISNYTIARTWEAKDECGLIETHTQIITVLDTTAPVPTSSFESILDVSCADIPEIPELEFIDECSTDVDLVFSETNSFDENIIADYQIVRSWRVSDVCDNEEVYTQTLNVSLDERLNDVNAEDICFDNGVVNLDDFLAEDVYGGTWEIVEGNPVATVTGSIFDPTNLGDAYSPSFNPNTEGIRYVLRYTGFQDGCLNVTDVIMVVDAKCKVLPCGDKDISISTALTPNGDSFNKTFDIEGITLCGYTAEVKIFNRWGAIVYDSKSYTLGSEREGSAFSSDSGFGKWDGTSPKSSIGNNGKLPNGTYYYIIKLVNPISGELELDPITGPVYLGTK